MKYELNGQSFAESVSNRLKAVGLTDIQFLAANSSNLEFGNAEAVFGVGPIVVRVVRDRGQEFVEIGSSNAPNQFHQFDDVQIAMGWKTIDDVLAKTEPEDLTTVFLRLYANLPALTAAFSDNREEFTRARIERASRARGRAFLERLQQPE